MSTLKKHIIAAAEPFDRIDDSTFAEKFDRFQDARLILIGDASHGTSEFYTARAAITKRLVERFGFNIVAAEADWPDAHSVDQYVRHQTTVSAAESLNAFQRFPTWMWRNQEFKEFIEWLHRHNGDCPESEQAGFYGLDLYSLGASIRTVIDYLDKVNPDAAQDARKRYGCLQPWIEDPAQYGLVALKLGEAPCAEGVRKVLSDLLIRRLEYARKSDGALLDAEMNAQIVRDAEEYYRALYHDPDLSWNLRDVHMFKILSRLLETKGSKAIVWAHNSHVGDARYTSMGMSRNELNIGQLCRENFGKDVVIIGCGTHTGTVAAANDWDGKMEVMKVVPSLEDSYERVMFNSGVPRFLLDLNRHKELTQMLMKPRLERFIGVIYRPATERWSHYSKAVLPKQMDAYVWFQESKAVIPFETDQPQFPPAVDETYPFGL
ncbi:putative erythromycin esterase [Linnemannia elongata]|nr:putative erythromycin esterase [Linnemannia elongata]